MLDFARDKALWERVRTSADFAQHRSELEELYKNAFSEEPRPHSAEEILENNDNGLWRRQFDHLQSAALMSLIYPENEEYYKNLLKIVWAYLNEYTWAPLGHYTEYYYQRTPKDFDFGLIDIFAASVSFSLAEIKSLFADRFPKLLKDRISYEIRRRTIEPYLNRKFFWETHNNNWTAVCTGAVGGVLMYEDPELFFQNQERLHASMECYLDSYKDDGMCVEGVGYWTFGFGFFASYAMLERELTNGEVDWFKREKVKQISKYLQKMFLQKHVLVTFSDCSVEQRYFFALPHMLRSIYGDEIERLPKELGHAVYDNTHFNFALRSFIYYDSSNISDDIVSDVTYAADDSRYFVKRTGSYGFAAKGGNHWESHNHQDCGTFILARHNKQIICDIGAGPYEEGYHTDKRYTFFHPSAFSHNLPIFGGIGQGSASTDVICVEYDEKSSSIYMDLTSAYDIPFLKKIERGLTLKESEIELTDRYSLEQDAEVTERFVSLIEPKMVDDVAVIDDVSLIVDTPIIPKITTKAVKAHIINDHNVYIIDYILPKGTREFTIKFSMPNS